MTEYASLVISAESSDLVTAAKRVRDLKKPTDEAGRSNERMSDTVVRMTAALQRQEATFDKTADEIQLYDAAVAGATDEDIRAIRALQQKQKALTLQQEKLRNVTGASRGITQAFRVQKGATQQAAFQIQDFAVQVGGGTSALRSFSQQAPQLLGILGPGGAILGGVVAVAGALAMSFLPNMMKSEKATEQLTEALAALNGIIKETRDGTNVLSDAFADLVKNNVIVSQATIKEALLKTNDALDAANEKSKELAESLSPNELGGRFNLVALDLGRLRTKFLEGNSTLAEFNKEVNTLFLKQEDPSKDFREVREEISKLASEAQKAAERRDILLGGTKGVKTETQNKDDKKAEKEAAKVVAEELKIAAAREAADIAAYNQRVLNAEKNIGLLEDSYRTQEEKLQDSYNEQLSIINAAESLKLDTYKSYDQLRVEAEAAYTDALKAETEKRANIEKAADQMVYQSKLGLVGQLGALLEQQAKEGSAAAKIGYAMTQGIQIAATINSAEVAAAGQLASFAGVPDPSNTLYVAALARSKAMRTLGYASAGIIAGNTVGNLVGRAQGGQVRAGEPYKVGEYGEEMFVPKSDGRIIPNSSGSGGTGINLVTNIKVIGGRPDAQVENTISQVGDAKFIQNVVINQLANSTSKMNRQLQSTYQMVPKGTR